MMALLGNINLNAFEGMECEKGETRKVKNLRVYDFPNTFKFKF